MDAERKRCAKCGRRLSRKLKSTAKFCDVNCRTGKYHQDKRRPKQPARVSPLSGDDRARLIAFIQAHAPPGTIGYSIGRQPKPGTWEYFPPRELGKMPFLPFGDLPPPEWIGLFALFFWTADLQPIEAPRLPQGIYLPRR